MFVSVADIKDTTGYDVSPETIRLAQLMIETLIGKSEVEVEDAGDLATLARATLFQAIYINGTEEDILEQAAVKSIVMNDATSVFDTAMFSPFMSPLAVLTCRKLTWLGPRTIHTGPIFDTVPVPRWETE